MAHRLFVSLLVLACILLLVEFILRFRHQPTIGTAERVTKSVGRNIENSISPLPLTSYTFWTGELDEAVLLCWYINFKNPEVRQIFVTDNHSDWKIKASKYPFLNELEQIPLDWKSLLDSMEVPYDPHLIDHLPNLSVSSQSDCFRVIITMAHDNVFHMDADQCIFTWKLSGYHLGDLDFVVPNMIEGMLPNLDLSNGFYKITGKNREIFRNEMKREFLQDGTFSQLQAQEEFWGVLGPRFFTSVLDRAFPHLKLFNKENVVPGDLVQIPFRAAYGWGWWEQHNNFCLAWNQQVKEHRLGIHLYNEKRKLFYHDMVHLLNQIIQDGNTKCRDHL